MNLLEPNQSPIRVLIVEDDPITQLGLEQFFQSYPQFTIVGEAGDGYSGIEMATTLAPDLVVMDIGLPQLDGIAATHQIKQVSRDIRVLVLTSHNSQTEAIAALSSGADAYCIKGKNLERLSIAIAAVQDGAAYLDPQIARYVMSQLKPMPVQPPAIRLSDRELEVLKLLVDGKTNPEIATLLYLSASTIKVHIRNIMTKLAVDDRVQAAVVALRTGLL